MPTTWSPEYEWGPGNGDTNYELALCKWGLRTTLLAAAKLNISQNDDPRLASFQERLQAFAPFPRDARGFMVSRNITFKPPHSAASHLLPIIFAMEDVSIEDIAVSLDTW